MGCVHSLRVVRRTGGYRLPERAEWSLEGSWPGGKNMDAPSQVVAEGDRAFVDEDFEKAVERYTEVGKWIPGCFPCVPLCAC
jgi:hypothetical protein